MPVNDMPRCSWQQASISQALVNQPEKGLIKARLLGLAIGKTNITKNEVSREVGLSPWKLTIFALENELPIFWKENLYGQEIIKEYHDAKQKESL